MVSLGRCLPSPSQAAFAPVSSGNETGQTVFTLICKTQGKKNRVLVKLHIQM